ncbi:MAG: ABC transporter substrate-binding protein [Paracoccaceae bacterium]
MTQTLHAGYVPLVDAAPLIIARALGFAEEEGLDLRLERAASWSMLRDMLDFGQVDAAQMLSVIPVARALGLGGGTVPLEAPMVLALNGETLGLSRRLAVNLDAPFGDALAMGQALGRLQGPLRMGVPFPFSMQTELLHYWLERAAPGVAVSIRTVPPPRMADALQADEIDGFCVGEPWGSHAVEVAGARLLLPGSAIWSQAPEKVLATRAGWCEAQPDAAGCLMRAVWRAGRWLAEPGNLLTAVEVLASPGHLGISADLIEHSLTGRIMVAADGSEARADQFLTFHQGAANFPWRSQAAWIAARLAARFGLDLQTAQDKARACFRSDLYRLHLASAGAALPRSSDKAEGILSQAEQVPATHGSLTLQRNRFFDGAIFDPAAGVR